MASNGRIAIPPTGPGLGIAPERIPWREVKGMRIIAAHAYHRIDYAEVWVTLRDGVPKMAEAIRRWQQEQA